MSPLRQPPQGAGGLFSSTISEQATTGGIRLFDKNNNDEEMTFDGGGMNMSPPRVSKTTANLPSADLFGSSSTTSSNQHSQTATNRTTSSSRRRGLRTRLSSASPDGNFASDVSSFDEPVLRNMDMNTTTMPSSPSSTSSTAATNVGSGSTRRKRPSDQHPAGREDFIMEEATTTTSDEDDHDDMFVSPRPSPTYRTIDGRTVTSKNPFSPYTPTQQHDCDELMNSDSILQKAPSFPVSLYGSSSRHSSLDASNGSTSASLTAGHSINIRPKLNLLRRDHAPPPPPPPSQSTAEAARAGYPDQHGRYSFTGSPIQELDFMEQDDCTNMGSKIRRLKLDDDAGTTAHSLFVETDNTTANSTAAAVAKDSDISPTDVMNFPTPTPKAPPSAPRKASRPLRYTPLSNKQPPQTPMPGRRNVARRPLEGGNDNVYGEYNDHDAMMMGASGAAAAPPKSRFHQDFDIIGELGTGSFGTVYKCLSRLDGCMYAVKAAKRKAKGNADRDRMLKEVYALAALSDQADTAAFHCVRYHQAWMEENRLYIQTEMCTSTLQSEMNRGRLSDARMWKLLREMLLALEFIHRNGMVHLDLKPENIFIKNDQFKLGDFGLVSQTTSNNDVEEGDSRYMSKELLSGDHEDLTKSDIFSLGATMYEICLGRPLPMDGQEWQDIRSGSLLPLHDTPYEMELLIKKMMHPDPTARPTASQLLKQPQLLSDEQKQLMAEKSKVLQANLALALQTQKLKKLTPPRRGALIRANTWNGSNSFGG